MPRMGIRILCSECKEEKSRKATSRCMKCGLDGSCVEETMKKVFAVTLITLLGGGVFAAWTHAQQGSQAAAPAKAPAREISSLQLQQQIPVPNVMGRLDHMSSDPKRRLLFVSALGNNSAEIIDTFAGRVVHSITGLAQPQGILYVPDFNKLVIA